MQGDKTDLPAIYDMYKCSATNCLHETRDIAEEDDVIVRKKHYHKDCKKTADDIKEIIDVFYKRVNENVVFSKLTSVIKTIVYKRNVPADTLLYGLKYYLDHGGIINYPEGLYYVMQDKKVQEVCAKRNAKKVMQQPNAIVTDEDQEETTFTYKPSKKGVFDV